MERIAQIIGTLPGGGVKNVMFNYYRKIDKDKYQFDFYYDCKQDPMIPQELIDMGARFYQIPNHKNIFKCIKALREYFRENKYNIVHSGMNSLSFVSLFAAKKERIRIRILHNHSVPGGNELIKNILKNVFKTISLKYANVYFACSEIAAKWMFGERKDVFIMKNAIDFSRFKKPNKKNVSNIIKNYELKDKNVVGIVGRLTYAKNHRFLIEVFRKLKKIDEDAVLIIVGDGELREEIENQIKSYDLEDCVHITGNVDNVEDYYHVMNVSVNPSFFEGLSLATIESQVSGVPVLISRGIPEEAIISDSGVKQLDLQDDIETWINSITELMKEKIVMNKKSLEYDIDNEVLKLQNEYDRLLNNYEKK